MSPASLPQATSHGLDQARRRHRRINGAFWFCMALIPLGVLGPCGLSILAYQLWGPSVSAPVGLSALLCPLVGVAGALLLRGARGRARRSLALAELASARGLRFELRPSLAKYEFLKSVSFMEAPHTASGVNLLEGQAGRWPLLALDYEYSYVWGGVTEVGAQTLAVFLSGFERLPPFGVFPIGVLGRLENFFLGRGGAIPFPHAPNFQSRFAVVGADPAAVAACLRPPLMDLLLGDPQLSLIVEDGRLLVFRRLTYVPPRDYAAFLAQAYRVAELLA